MSGPQTRKKQKARQKRRKVLLAAAAAAAALGGITALALGGCSPQPGTSATTYVEDISPSAALDEFSATMIERAWVDAAAHERRLDAATVGGDVADFEIIDTIEPEKPCLTETEACLEETDAAAAEYATRLGTELDGRSERGSDLIGPLVELSGINGNVFYVTDGCVNTRDPQRSLCRHVPADEAEASRIAGDIVAEYGIEGAFAEVDDLYLVGIGSTADGGVGGANANMLRLTWRYIAEAAGVQAEGIHISAGLPTD